LKATDQLGDADVEWGEKLKWLGYEDLGWIEMAQDTIQWRALVNTVMEFRYP
jgi:hypothetical protein